MKRKNFLASLVAIGATGPVLATSAVATNAKAAPSLLIPPYLRNGDTIGITCPAGDITAAAIEPSVQLIQSWGFRVRIGDTVGKKDFIFGGTDAERAADFQQMLNDPELSAILCARGGYGAVHLIDQLLLQVRPDRLRNKHARGRGTLLSLIFIAPANNRRGQRV